MTPFETIKSSLNPGEYAFLTREFRRVWNPLQGIYDRPRTIEKNPRTRPTFKRSKRGGSGKPYESQFDRPAYTTLVGLREALHDAQEGVCYLCKKPLLWERSLDHVTPVSLGGPNYKNLLATHHDCNNEKGARRPTWEELQFLAKVNAALYPKSSNPEEENTSSYVP